MSIETKRIKNTQLPSMYFGCDPEFFLEKDGEVIGSEKLISENGLEFLGGLGTNKVIRDGIQTELNPAPNTCRQRVARNISRCFIALKEQITTDGTGIKVNFEQTRTITEKEMDSLSDDSKQFGCKESRSVAGENSKIAIKDASKYFKRSAGGHIHLSPPSYGKAMVQNDAERVIKLMDIIVGNTCVLLDRDKGNIERRKNYGKAGEFRLPSHGIEYRVLSNFWLRSYVLMSFVFSLTRFALHCYLNGHAERFFAVVDYDDIQKAINENDAELARKNFDKVKELFPIGDIDVNNPLTQKNLKKFDKFVEKGMDHWFKEDPLTHWKNVKPEGGSDGWEAFVEHTLSE